MPALTRRLAPSRRTLLNCVAYTFLSLGCCPLVRDARMFSPYRALKRCLHHRGTIPDFCNPETGSGGST